jgi:predicted transcriptional regulator
MRLNYLLAILTGEYWRGFAGFFERRTLDEKIGRPEKESFWELLRDRALDYQRVFYTPRIAPYRPKRPEAASRFRRSVRVVRLCKLHSSRFPKRLLPTKRLDFSLVAWGKMMYIGCNDCNQGGVFMGRSTTMGVKLDETTRERLKQLGEAKQRTPHWIMRKAIVTYLDQEEQWEREKKEDLDRWERYQATGRHVSHEAVEAWLETWGSDEEEECPGPAD